MRFDFGLILASLHEPRRVARWLIDQRFGLVFAGMALLLSVVLTAGLTNLSFRIFPEELPPEWVDLIQNPMKLALMQGLVLLVMAMLGVAVGRLFKGQGRFDDAVLLLAMVEFLMLALQFVQMFFLLVFPSLAQALGIFGIVLSLWMIANFLAELHGFKSALLVFGGMFATLFLLSFAAALVMLLTTASGA